MTMTATKHDWHVFDVLRGLEVRQATSRLRPNRWEVRHVGGAVVVGLDDVQWDALRSGGPLPEVLGDG
jgi:hypothetical protein